MNQVYVVYTYCMRTDIPDLRQDSEVVTIEHVSVLQERFGQVLDDAYPGEYISSIVIDNFDPLAMREELLTIFTQKAFLTLFQTEIGKGVLMGAFYQAYIDGGAGEEDGV